jgi:hypothetical protein
MKIKDLAKEPSILGVIGDTNEAKSNLLYHLIEEFKKEGTFKLYSYGLRVKIPGNQEIFSVEELEQIKNSIIILDEVMTLWDLENKMAKRKIEKSLRLIFHNNNLLIICLLPENVKKFIAGKIQKYFFKKVTIPDLINGSKTKNIILGYKGQELGSSILNLEKGETLFFDGLHYEKLNIPYYKQYDTKRNNPQIIQKVTKKVSKKVNQKVQKNIPSQIGEEVKGEENHF